MAKGLDIKVLINGVTYPCYETLGASLRFEQLSGKDVTKMDASSVKDVTTFLYCCVASACNREGKSFNMELIDFADAVDSDVLEDWNKGMREKLEEAVTNVEEEKKTTA